jgi:hypothetical protein
MGSLTTEQLANNLDRVRNQIADTCLAAGRDPGEVRLVAVTKYVDASVIRMLARCGQAVMGENRPQQLVARRHELADLPLEWHLIGHLQRNKVRLVVPGTALIHSIDSVRLAEAIEAEAASAGVVVRGLLEVNVSGDEAKHGFARPELIPALEQLDGLRHLELCGLMAMSGVEADADTARRQFEAVRELAVHCRARGTGRFQLNELSMGMSGDFREAIAAGATIVRIGSALYHA